MTYQRDPDKTADYQRAYREKHKEKLRAYFKERKRKHKELLKQLYENNQADQGQSNPD